MPFRIEKRGKDKFLHLIGLVDTFTLGRLANGRRFQQLSTVLIKEYASQKLLRFNPNKKDFSERFLFALNF